MNDINNIESIKDKQEKSNKLIDYYINDVNIESWLNNNEKITIINFKDRVEYKKFNKYHRLNGPAIDYNNDSLDKYYYKGKNYDSKEEWLKVTTKELRRIKIKRLKNL